MNIELSLDTKSINKAIKELEKYKRDLEQKKRTFMERLAEFGRNNASFLYPKGEISVSVVWKDENTIAVRASGEEIAFIEFGTGITYGGGHPKPVIYDEGVARQMGKGTFPSDKGHWDDPNGWWYPLGNGEYAHTYGNPPTATMYNTARAMERQAQIIIKEVFG